MFRYISRKLHSLNFVELSMMSLSMYHLLKVYLASVLEATAGDRGFALTRLHSSSQPEKPNFDLSPYLSRFQGKGEVLVPVTLEQVFIAGRLRRTSRSCHFYRSHRNHLLFSGPVPQISLLASSSGFLLTPPPSMRWWNTSWCIYLR